MTFRGLDYFFAFLRAPPAGARVCGWLCCRLGFLAQRAPLLELALQDQSVTGNCATAVTSFAYAKGQCLVLCWPESK